MKPSGNHPTIPVLLAAGVVLITLMAFWPVQYNGFINLDDTFFITENPHVISGISWENIRWAFTLGNQNEKGHYTFHPLTWISFMLDCELFGLNPRGHHLSNLFLHLVNTALLFFLLQRMTGKPGRSAFVACLFGIHPLHVESVAWATERKDTLSTLFWFLTLWAYIRYVEKPDWKKYLRIAVFFLLGLLSKSMLVTIPFLLLLLDFWPLQRMKFRRDAKPTVLPQGENVSPAPLTTVTESPYVKETIPRLIREKVPLLGLSLLFGLLTLLDQQWGGAVSSLETVPLSMRLSNVILAYWEYIWKMFWPVQLSVFYPFLAQELTLGKTAMAAAILAVITAGAIWRWKKSPYLAAGWFWYLIVLVPVIGFVQVGAQSMADRYTYVSLIGLFLAGTWLSMDLLGSLGAMARRLLTFSAVVILVVLAFLTRTQVGYWKTDISLYRHSLSVAEKAYVLHLNLGEALMKIRQYDESIRHNLRALELNPGNILATTNLAAGYINTRQVEKAEQLCRQALRQSPEDSRLLNTMGVVLMKTGEERWPEALACLEKSLQIDPDSANTHIILGDLYTAMGKEEQAIEQYRQTLRLNPFQPVALNNLGLEMVRRKSYQEGIAYYRRALEVDPKDPSTNSNLGMAYLLVGKLDEAIGLFSQALAVAPRSADIQCNMGVALLATRRFDQAIEHFQRALELDPSLEKAKIGLGRALQAKGSGR